MSTSGKLGHCTKMKQKWEKVRENAGATPRWALSGPLSFCSLFNSVNPHSPPWLHESVSLFFKRLRVGFQFLAVRRQRPNYWRWRESSLSSLRCLSESTSLWITHPWQSTVIWCDCLFTSSWQHPGSHLSHVLWRQAQTSLTHCHFQVAEWRQSLKINPNLQSFLWGI